MIMKRTNKNKNKKLNVILRVNKTTISSLRDILTLISSASHDDEKTRNNKEEGK